ncbi:unnamed protein product [Prorocentrum cordatum]|uniref:Alpha-type protein kinase domain-containing protein n=1 Tax=Prorocentrum cordatum TaxID=2364126 RepID=A0ABN9W999_9DINO|nr:unnamed protein product [Polarella glacialis]
MRTEDVVDDASHVSRIAAVTACLCSFFDAQAPSCNDYFSLVSFNDTSTVHFSAKMVIEARDHVFGLTLRAKKSTEFVCGLSTAKEVLQTHAGMGSPHLLVFSDGRPGDMHRMLQTAQQLLASVSGLRVHAIGFGDSLTSFDYLQQLASIGSGTFVPSALSLGALKQAFSSITSTITSTKSSSSVFSFKDVGSQIRSADEDGSAQGCRRHLRQVTFELPNQYTFSKDSVTFTCVRSLFKFDGKVFEQKEMRDGPYDVKMRTNPFTMGGMRLVHCFQDKTVRLYGACDRDGTEYDSDNFDARLVAKLSRYSDPFYNNHEVVAAYAKSSAAASFYSRCFQMQLADRLKGEGRTCAKIVFVECFLYSVLPFLDGPQAPADCLIGERHLPGVFLKYNSNKGFVNWEAPYSEVAQAFSHFTYWMSQGRILVADLQGVLIHRRRPHLIFTDPQVLSLDGSFGPGDLGPKGIAAFFKSHKCGRTCKGLGLSSHNFVNASDGGAGELSGNADHIVRDQGKQKRECRECSGKHVKVRKHTSMGCAVVTLESAHVRDRILEGGSGAIINGIKVQMKPHFPRETKAEAPTEIFIAWGRQAEKRWPLGESVLAAYFDKLHIELSAAAQTKLSSETITQPMRLVSPPRTHLLVAPPAASSCAGLHGVARPVVAAQLAETSAAMSSHGSAPATGSLPGLPNSKISDCL